MNRSLTGHTIEYGARLAAKRDRRAGFHAINCTSWAGQAESRRPSAVEIDAISAYCGAVRPVYENAKNCIGQLSGILLLIQTGCLERRDELIMAAIARQLAESEELWGGLPKAEVTTRHRTTLRNLLDLLRDIFARMDRLSDLVETSSADLDQVVAALFRAHRVLLGLSDPAAGLSPVDFQAACCNCQPAKGEFGSNYASVGEN